MVFNGRWRVGMDLGGPSAVSRLSGYSNFLFKEMVMREHSQMWDKTGTRVAGVILG